jgi:hypothetical protein
MAKIINLKKDVLTVQAERHKSAAPIKYYVDENDCHICISHALDKDGYPRVYVGKDRRMSHYIYYLQTGEWPPKGMVVMHTCDNPQCINPDHLKLGTQKENMADMKAKGRAKLNSPKKRFTDDEILYIRYFNKETTRALAIKYGVIENTIRNIRKNRSYKDITIDSVARNKIVV